MKTYILFSSQYTFHKITKIHHTKKEKRKKKNTHYYQGTIKTSSNGKIQFKGHSFSKHMFLGNLTLGLLTH
jgi:hypothetical protein